MINGSLSGFKQDGSWECVVKCGGWVSEVPESRGGPEAGRNDSEERHLKTGEELVRDVSKETIEKASIDPEKVIGTLTEKGFEMFEKAAYSAVRGKAGPLYQ